MDDLPSLPFSPQERDIDLLLLEQFQLAPAFLDRFCAAIGLPAGSLVSARHSVYRGNGETDVLVHVATPSGRVAIMIEDKIGAAMQPDQCGRYHERGQALCAAGEADRYVAVLCAPQAYIASIPASEDWHARIAFEELAVMLGDDVSAHVRWRRAVLLASAARVKRARQADAGKKSTGPDTPADSMLVGLAAMKSAYRAFVLRHYPLLSARVQTGRDREYFLGALGLPKGIRFKHHLFAGEVNLILVAKRRAAAESVLADGLPDGMWDLSHNGEWHIRAGVEAMDPAMPFEQQEEIARAALDRIMQMLPLAERVARAAEGGKA